MSTQNEFSSFKLLLKQVYSAHSSKVKELENEIKFLKEKLAEKERNTNTNVGDCKRCIELEAAFKTCKKALHEQSKWFENFGQKFSIFNSTEIENHEFKDATESSSYALEASKLSNNLKKNSTVCDKNESSVILQGKDTDVQSHVNRAEKLSVSSSNQNLLSKVILDDCESFDVYTVTFNHNLKHNTNTKSDSMILAPDSLSTVLDDKGYNNGKNDVKECNIKENGKSKTLSKLVKVESPKTVEDNHQDCKVAHKRLSSETVNESRPKKCHKLGFPGSNSEISKTEENTSGIIVPKILVSEPSKVSENVEGVKATTVSNKNNIQLPKKKSAITKITPLKDNENEIPKSLTLSNKSVNDIKNKTISNQISPSLLPSHINILPKIIDLDPISNDDDFLEQNSVNKVHYSEDSWDSCDRKKLKKTRNAKFIKSTSKYKMTLDAPPLNYKKPTFKQTKLSKSIFQSKSSDSIKKSPKKPKLSKNNFDSLTMEDNFPTVLQDHFQSSTSLDNIKSPIVDIDATFIPENFKLESPQFNTTKVKKNTIENLNLKNGNLFSNISFPEEVYSSLNNVENSCIIEDEIKDSSSLDNAELKENMSSFDRLPMPEEPTYKYKNDVVRKKAERRQLNGFDCKECEKYYSELGLTEKEKKERMKKCSRHRGRYTPPATPDHFWELDFPDTEECKARGYLNETQKVNLNNICNI